MKHQHPPTSRVSAFTHRTRIVLVALLAAALVSLLATTSPDAARAYTAMLVTPVATQTGFTLTSPAEGSLLPCGQPITVTGTGGDPSANVYLSLGDVLAFQVFQEFGTGPNTGSRVVTIGPGSCGRTSLFYIQDVPPTTLTYGPVFTVGSAPTCVSPPSDMVSWWSGDGHTKDLQDNNDGALQGGATFAPGKVAQAFSFDGVDDFVDIQPNPNLDLTQVLTIDAWINPSVANQSGGIVEKTVANAVNTQYSLFLAGGGIVFRLIKIPGVDHATIGGGMIPINTWTHVAATWDGATMKLFINGIQQPQTLSVASPINGGVGPTLIGKQGSNINRFTGLIDEVEIFNRALSAQEINAIYLADTAGKCKPAPTPTPTPTPLTCTPPPSDMVSWWSGDGHTKDLQDNNDGALQGGATFAPGKVAQAFSFDGVDDFVDLPYNSNLNLTQELTIDAWVNPSVINQDRTIVEKTVGNGVNTQYLLFLENGGVVFRLIKIPGVDHRTIRSDSVIPTNAWTHVAATWDGATMKLFINGFQQAQTFPVTAPINGGVGPTLIGKSGSNINHFAGLIDEVEIFSRALSSQEIRDIYLADIAGKCKPPLPCTVAPVFNIPSTAGPWIQGLNPTFDYGSHDNTPPIVIDASSGLALTPGTNLSVTYLSGTVQAGAGYAPNDANGLPGYVRNYCENFGCFPAVYMNPNTDLLAMALVGTFANNGVIMGNPFPIGNGPTALTVPTGANQLLLGINDTRYSDNSGSFTVTINRSGNTAPTVSCPSAFAAFADSNCQAVVPDVLSGVTASGSCNGPVTLSQSPAAGTLVGLGVTEITATATDTANNASNCTTTFTVTDNTPPAISPMPNITTTTDPGACSARVNFGPIASDNCSGVSFSCSTPSGSAFPIGTTQVTCTATDASGNTAATSFNVTVNNPAPTVSIDNPASGAIFAVGTNVTFGGTFGDNAGDLHTAQWSFSNNSQNILQSGVVNETAGILSANYAFTSAGVYLVSLRVTDHCGNSGTMNITSPDGLTAMVVIYDPNGGFVTGGGWIDSPAGAYTADPSLTGRASFGFVSKYHNGATTPTGNTEFQFRVANFNFRSSVYEWLVVAGARAQFKGSGTINGAGDYGFILTAIDGQLNGGGGADKFRIKIWKKNGGGLIYDNLLNAPDSADPTTTLGGGSIVIHK